LQDLGEKVTVITGKYSDAIEENVKQGGYTDFVECRNIIGRSLPDVLLKARDFMRSTPFLIHFNSKTKSKRLYIKN